jgi:osmotically-inducible protein OsmY
MPDPGSPHTHPDDYKKMGLDFERDNAAIPENRGERSPELAKAVQARIAIDGVNADAFGGAVLLTGIVSTRYDRERAENLAREVEGVTVVENRIHIQQNETGGPLLTTRDPDGGNEPTNQRS